MKTITMLGCLVLCAVLVGCDTRSEQEVLQEERVQNLKDTRAEWAATQEASYALVDQLEEEMSYDQVVEILGSAGEQKMSAQMGEIQRTIYEWMLEGDVFVKATFEDGILIKWGSK